MTTAPGTLAGLDELRLDLARRAATADRRNRPRRLVLGALLLLLAAAVALLAALGDRDEARTYLASESARATRVASLLTRWEQLEQAGDDPGHAALLSAPDPYLQSGFAERATRAGLRGVPTAPENARTVGSVRRLDYRFTGVTDDNAETLLTWVDLCAREIPGLWVSALTLRRQGQSIALEVTFTKFERVAQ